MDKQLLKFLNKEVNYIDTMCSVGREPLDQGREFMTIKFKEIQTDAPMYQFWHSSRKKAKPSNAEETLEKPKQERKTNGKKSYYAKVYISEIKKYPKKKLSYEYAGMCLHLTASIEWESGFLIIGRGKKRRNMNKQDIIRILEISDSTFRRFMSKLKELKLMEYDEKGYRMIGKLFGKGREIQCESNLKKE